MASASSAARYNSRKWFAAGGSTAPFAPQSGGNRLCGVYPDAVVCGGIRQFHRAV